MTQVYRHTLFNAVEADGVSGIMTHQDDFYHRSVYLSGTFTATVKVEVSPEATGDEWSEVVSETAVGVYSFSVVCRRVRASVSDYTDGAVTVKILSRAT